MILRSIIILVIGFSFSINHLTVKCSRSPNFPSTSTSVVGRTFKSSHNNNNNNNNDRTRIDSDLPTATVSRGNTQTRGSINRRRSASEVGQSNDNDMKALQKDGTVSNQFVSGKVNVTLSCQPEETVVDLNFKSPFRGVIQLGDDGCGLRGDGRYQYTLRAPHNKCGTKHVVSSGSFFNTIFIRYHPSLEMEGDLLKTILCKFGTEELSVG
ncbi:uncharacterized protein LOC141855624 [Brevipalpus obovatus]|uniref:uncharacterized protein LOC141855624 n=1 Tax=Brevipalpus obovatus TaxID=246614 RepID=UPI003D9F7CD4